MESGQEKIIDNPVTWRAPQASTEHTMSEAILLVLQPRDAMSE